MTGEADALGGFVQQILWADVIIKAVIGVAGLVR